MTRQHLVPLKSSAQLHPVLKWESPSLSPYLALEDSCYSGFGCCRAYNIIATVTACYSDLRSGVVGTYLSRVQNSFPGLVRYC